MKNNKLLLISLSVVLSIGITSCNNVKESVDVSTPSESPSPSSSEKESSTTLDSSTNKESSSPEVSTPEESSTPEDSSTSEQSSSSQESSTPEDSSTSEQSSSSQESSTPEQSSSSEESSTPEEIEETYTVTWKNYDGFVLETDLEVVKGSIPTYDGKTPIKESSNNNIYIFNGWTPSVSEVVCDITYTATFSEIDIGSASEYAPVISSDNKTVQYGLYPQSYVSDSTLISTLNTLQPSSTNNWYYYEGNYYVKETATVYNNESYTFNNGTAIVNKTQYWFKCEPITWTLLTNTDGTLYLVSTMLLDTCVYYNGYEDRTIGGNKVLANSYEYSNIRTWLNNDFFNNAFELNNSYIKETTIDNLSTTDKVFLPSYQDYLNSSYGFTSSNDLSNTRECKTTDYARVKGAWYNKTSNLKYNGTYWTRTSSSDYYYCSYNVNSGGYISEYAVDGSSHCVRPAILIKF